MLTWPIGIVSVLLYFVLFYQIQLYSDAVEQVYYLGASAYGWIIWRNGARSDEKEILTKNERRSKQGNEQAESTSDMKSTVLSNRRSGVNVEFGTLREIVLWIAVIIVFSILLGWFMKRVHVLLPVFFTEPASFPYMDAFTTVMSFVAMFLMARKKAVSWILWIIVDVIGIWLYFVKDARFLSLLYVILLGIAIKGLYRLLSSAPTGNLSVSPHSTNLHPS
jgi:nicotinamide mononucleotide transporter